MPHSVSRPWIGVAQSATHVWLTTAFTCRSHAAAQLMASPSHTHSSDARQTAASSQAMQCTDVGEAACQFTAAKAESAACSAAATQPGPPECPPCIPPSEWLQPGSSATNSNGRDLGSVTAFSADGSAKQASAAVSARRAEGDACDPADEGQEGAAHAVQHPLHAKGCAADQAASAATGFMQHTNAGAKTEPPAGRGAAAGRAAQPVQPPRSDASAPPGKAARHGKRDRGGRPKPPRPTHFMAIPLCQASLLPPADHHRRGAATRCNGVDGSQAIA